MSNQLEIRSEMEKAGCDKCVHWGQCLLDALADEGFSTLDLGRNCKGYEDRKEIYNK